MQVAVNALQCRAPHHQPCCVAVQGGSAAAAAEDPFANLDWRVKLAMLLLAKAKARAEGKFLCLGTRPPGDWWMVFPADMADGIPDEVRAAPPVAPFPCSVPAC